MPSNVDRVVVGLSGGVDSAVAASLLLQQGHQVTGLFMKNWEEDDDAAYCAAAEDLADAESVCHKLGIELRTINFSHEYWERVFAEFLDEYRAGRTPNPDVLCNREIKFKEFLDYARTLGAERIATGHYAGTRRSAQGWQLLRGKDADKDQSYFLFAVSVDALEHSLFPLSGLNKHEVRQIAKRRGFRVHDKKDSTGICFIGERRFKDFLSNYVGSAKGEIRDVEDRTLGQHDGLAFYTIGQRQGLGIGGAGDPWYVVSKDMDSNVLYVAQGHNHPALFSSWLQAKQLHWMNTPARPDINCSAKIRYRQQDQGCTVSIDGDTALVRFAEPQRAVTPGQAVVFYDQEVCLGGGTITYCEALATSGTAGRISGLSG